MGLLDGLVGNVIGSILGGNQTAESTGRRWEPGSGRKLAASNCAIDAAAKWRFGGRARQVPSKAASRSRRLLGRYRLKHEYFR